jgi:hypothetical protein
MFEREALKWAAWAWLLIAAVAMAVAQRQAAYIGLLESGLFWAACVLALIAVGALARLQSLGCDIAPDVFGLLSGGVVGMGAFAAFIVPSAPSKDAVWFRPPGVLVIGEQTIVSAILAKSVTADRIEAIMSGRADKGSDPGEIAREPISGRFKWVAMSLTGIDIAAQPEEARTRPATEGRPEIWEWVIKAESSAERPVPLAERRFLTLTVLGKSAPDDEGTLLVGKGYPVRVVASWQGYAHGAAAVVNFIVEHWEVALAIASALLVPIGVKLGLRARTAPKSGAPRPGGAGAGKP